MELADPRQTDLVIAFIDYKKAFDLMGIFNKYPG